MRSRSLLWSFNYAIQGIVYALRTQRNMRLHIVAATTVFVAALLFQVSRMELIALVLVVCLVLIAELANTALEAVVDLSVERYDPLAKIAKDVAAGAVLVSSLAAVAVGFLVFFTPLRRAAQEGLALVRQAPANLTVLALALTGIAVITVKAVTKEGTFLKGGWPSGHTALATAAATAVGYATGSAAALILALFVAALVAQSRVENGTHTIPQVAVGAVLGFLIATAVFQVFFV